MCIISIYSINYKYIRIFIVYIHLINLQKEYFGNKIKINDKDFHLICTKQQNCLGSIRYH